MKIALDAYNLGFKEGTGIATYGRELSKLLHHNGHDVSVIYGLQDVGKEEGIAWSEFIQSLIVYGEARKDNSSWKTNFKFGLAQFFGIPVSLDAVPVHKEVDCTSIAMRLPAFSQIFNLPHIYRKAHTFARLSNKNMLIRLPKGEKTDILHLTSPLPLSMPHTAKAVTFHDAIPLALPHSTRINLHEYRHLFKTSLGDADAVFTVSEYSKKNLINYFDIPEEKITVTYQAVDIPEYYLNLDNDEVSRFIDINFSLKFKDYFLFYGAVEPKKNILRILEAFSLAKTDSPIVIVGRNGWLFDDVKQFYEQVPPNNKNKFRRIPYSSFRTLMYLLKGARGLVFPSLCEGFGLPVLEAMQMKCPVITSNVSSLPEVGGEAVCYVDPTDPRSIAHAVDKFSSDIKYTESLIEKGLIQAQKFSRSNHYSKLYGVYQRLV